MKQIYTITLIFCCSFCLAQNKSIEYDSLVKIADTFFFKNNYVNAIENYNLAINGNNQKGKVLHRYRLASCYALTLDFDKAFEQLYTIVNKGNFKNHTLLEYDFNFQKMREDNRWKPLLNTIKDKEE